MKPVMRGFLFIIIILTMPCAGRAQGIKYIELKQVQLAYAPKTFYISNVTDSLPDSIAIGAITDSGKKQKIGLQGGVAASLKSFIKHNVKKSRSAQSITLNVSSIDIDAKQKGAVWEVKGSMDVAFYAGNVKLIDYTDGGHGEINTDPGEYAEQFIRRAIEQGLQKFDGWWPEHKNEIAISPVVKVNVTIGKTINMPGYIVYSLHRPLQISDFTATPRDDSSEMAQTGSGNTFVATNTIEKGQMVVNAMLTPFFEKAQSWFKEKGKTPELLAHEQAHFDITAIKTCELADAIRKAAFTKENYNALLAQLRKKYTDECNEEQATYDSETDHSKIKDKQMEWQQKIAKQVRSIGCY